MKRISKGLTMMELVLVIAILAIIATALLGSFISSLSLAENSRMMTIATNIARERIEDLINTRISNWEGIAGSSYSSVILSQPPPIGYSFNGSCRIDVSDVTDTLKLIRVVVCWRSKEGRIVGTDDGSGGGGLLDGVLNGAERSVVWPEGSGNEVLNSPVVVVTAISKI